MSARSQSSDGLHFEPASESNRFRWIVAQEGSRQSYGVPLAFHRLRKLRIMYADIWCRFGRSLLQRGPGGARALATRFHPEIPGQLVVSFSPAAIAARTSQHFRRERLGPAELAAEYCRFGSWYAHHIRRHLEGLEIDPSRDCFLGFNTNCLELMDLLHKRNIHTVIDQIDPGRVEEDMVLEESESWPGWENFSGRMGDAYWTRIKGEWQAADTILVNSEWSRQALIQQGVPSQKIIIVPVALEVHPHDLPLPVHATGTLKVLWLGSVILRKGIQYLVEAARLLEEENIEFILAGPLGISTKAIESFPDNITILGRITRDRLNEVYQKAHVFVLPTISDGFAITQLEAMSHGLPVVTTPNCGRVVTDGCDGLIVPPRDSRALADALARLESNRPFVREMSCNALQTVMKYDLPSNARLINRLVREQRKSCQERDHASPTTAPKYAT